MVIRPKHYALSILLLAFSSFIFWVNIQWGNPVNHSLQLAGYTFVLIFMAFAMYWEIRDFWQYRWYRSTTPHIDIRSVEIPLNPERTTNGGDIKYLFADILIPENVSSETSVVIFSHGFSDDRLYTRHYTVPIATAGFVVVSYDCRGVGRSKKAGGNHQFAEIAEDLGDVISYVVTHPELKDRPIHLVGFSLGAFGSIKQGLWRPEVGKVVALAAMSNYGNNLPKSPIPFKGKWWVWLRYKFFGVMFNPKPPINQILSPSFQIAQRKSEFSDKEGWLSFISGKLFLIHSRNDRIVPMENLIENLKASNLPPENWMVTGSGGHNFLRHEFVVASTIIEVLKRN